MKFFLLQLLSFNVYVAIFEELDQQPLRYKFVHLTISLQHQLSWQVRYKSPVILVLIDSSSITKSELPKNGFSLMWS